MPHFLIRGLDSEDRFNPNCWHFLIIEDPIKISESNVFSRKGHPKYKGPLMIVETSQSPADHMALGGGHGGDYFSTCHHVNVINIIY